MVDTLLLILCFTSVVIWFVQEKYARVQMFDNLNRVVNKKHSIPLDQLQTETMPDWNDILLKATSVLWVGWAASVILIKDGDFAFILVMLTLLAGFIAGLDTVLFAKSREVFVASATVDEYLNKYNEDQRETLQHFFGKDMLIGEYAKSFFPVLGLVLVLRSFIVEPFQIPSGSMIPTLEVGDYILVNKFQYGLRLPVLGTKIVEIDEPKRGDVMVFFPPHKDIYFIKRVIGLPGDQITYKNKTFYINGNELEKEFLANIPDVRGAINRLYRENYDDKSYSINTVKGVYRPETDDVSVTIKPGHYFMVGDNRDNSSDSRVWGQVPEDRIVGKAFAIWMHWPSITQLPSFSRVGSFD